MAKPACSDEEFITLFKQHGATETAKILGVSVRAVQIRRRNQERLTDTILVSPNKVSGLPAWQAMYAARIPLTIDSGTVLIGSDIHIWPNVESSARRAFVHLGKELQAKIILLNGDVFDGASASRHPPIGWESRPSIRQELDAVEEWLTELEDSNRDAKRLWLMGNHDYRFENKLSAGSPEHKDVKGFALKDQFPKWEIGISTWINDNVVVKHRWKGGVHAAHNNTVNAGKTMVTGHLHSLKVTPFDDYNGTRFGIDTGTLADPYGPQFRYSEDNPLNHRSGFAVLTFHKGKLLWPELAHVLSDDTFEFRGKVIKV